MAELLYILQYISLPIILLIAAGFVFQKIFKTEVRTFSKLLIYLFIPIVIFTKIYRMEISWDFILIVMPYVALLEVCMYLISLVISGIFHYKKSMRNSLANAFIMFNTGNYGIPLIALAFPGSALAMASQLFIIVTQNLTINTVGVFLLSSGNSSRSRALKNIIKMPSLYAILLLLVVKVCGITLPNVITIPMGYISDAFVALALLTLGIQLAEVKFGTRLKEVLTATVFKMLLPPLIAFGLIHLLGIEGLLAQALIVGIATPTAVNTAVYAREFNNEPDFAAQVVLATTVFATFTLPLVIYFARGYFVA